MTPNGPQRRILEVSASPAVSPNETSLGIFPGVRINWGRGRLAAFASQTSFVAQFCALNDLKPKAFKSFFARYFQRGENPWWSLNNEDVPALARLLDEPSRVVTTLSAKLQLPSCYGTFSTNFDAVRHDQYISYCPSCLSTGYHSAFHEAQWLYLCPIHREPLARRSFFGSYEKYVGAIADLLRDACPTWPATQLKRGLPDRHRRKEIRELLEWLTIVGQRTDAISAQNVELFRQSPYKFSRLGVLLGRLDALQNIPRSLVEILLVPPCPQTQEVEVLSRDLGALIAETAKTISLGRLLDYYSVTAAAFRLSKKFRSLATSGIERLRQQHQVCHCEWRWSRYSGWSRAEVGEIHNLYYLCPYTYAMETLNSNWLDFFDYGVSTRMQNKMGLAYAWEGAEMVRRGLATYVDSGDSPAAADYGLRGYRLPELTVGDDLDQVLDMILCKRVAAQIEYLVAWIASLTPQTHPVQPAWPGGLNLFFDGHSASISSWIPGTFRGSQTPEGRWREGCARDVLRK